MSMKESNGCLKISLVFVSFWTTSRILDASVAASLRVKAELEEKSAKENL